MILNPNQRRQGDVLFVRVEFRPAWARNAPAHRDESDRLIVEYGAGSGHAHTIREHNAAGFRAGTTPAQEVAGLDYVEVGGSTPVTLRHEHSDGHHAEHEELALLPGCYERAVQVEFDPEEERRIAD